eukprot:753021-Hanusia_phi.AAC.6
MTAQPQLLAKRTQRTVGRGGGKEGGREVGRYACMEGRGVAKKENGGSESHFIGHFTSFPVVFAEPSAQMSSDCVEGRQTCTVNVENLQGNILVEVIRGKQTFHLSKSSGSKSIGGGKRKETKIRGTRKRKKHGGQREGES